MSRFKTQFCPQGHDQDLVNGKTKQGQCRICHNDQNKNYQKDHKQELVTYMNKYYHIKRDEILAQHKEYRDSGKFDKTGYEKEYKKNRQKEDINFKLVCNLHNRLYDALKKNQKKGSAVKDLGCSVNFLKQYLESKFLPDMTWNNWGKGPDNWNIDHIIPLSSFDLTDRDQLLKVVHYTNLQPLWEPDNLQKSSKILVVNI
jgi:hypothetical protein